MLLKLDHLGEEVLESRLPGICELSRTFAHVDPVKEPIPVVPTCHYMMGGIPTGVSGQALQQDSQGNDVMIDGLYSAGEAACVSVHGANRLGGNSLLDILVFGRASGLDVIENLKENKNHRPMNETSVEAAMARFSRLDQQGEGISVSELREEFRKTMEDHAGVFRTEEIMAEGVEKLKALRAKLPDVRLGDRSKVFNTARVEALELENLVDTGIAIAYSALMRKESRGAHSRPDYPGRDDENWMKHSLYFKDGDRMDYKPVQTKPLTVETFPPKERVY